MSGHCLAIVSLIYIFFYIYILIYRHVQETKKKVYLFCTSVQKVTILFFVHSIAWSHEQMVGKEALSQ